MRRLVCALVFNKYRTKLLHEFATRFMFEIYITSAGLVYNLNSTGNCVLLEKANMLSWKGLLE